jgi:hypothetical protein
LDPETEAPLRLAEANGKGVVVRYTLTELAGAVAAVANHCEDERFQRRLGQRQRRTSGGEGQQRWPATETFPMFDHWQPEDLLEASALVGAAIAFAIGLVQYRGAQQWSVASLQYAIG